MYGKDLRKAKDRTNFSVLDRYEFEVMGNTPLEERYDILCGSFEKNYHSCLLQTAGHQKLCKSYRKIFYACQSANIIGYEAK